VEDEAGERESSVDIVEHITHSEDRVSDDECR